MKADDSFFLTVEENHKLGSKTTCSKKTMNWVLDKDIQAAVGNPQFTPECECIRGASFRYTT